MDDTLLKTKIYVKLTVSNICKKDIPTHYLYSSFAKHLTECIEKKYNSFIIEEKAVPEIDSTQYLLTGFFFSEDELYTLLDEYKKEIIKEILKEGISV